MLLYVGKCFIRRGFVPVAFDCSKRVFSRFACCIVDCGLGLNTKLGIHNMRVVVIPNCWPGLESSFLLVNSRNPSAAI